MAGAADQRLSGAQERPVGGRFQPPVADQGARAAATTATAATTAATAARTRTRDPAARAARTRTTRTRAARTRASRTRATRTGEIWFFFFPFRSTQNGSRK